MEDDPQTKAEAEYARLAAETRSWVNSLPEAIRSPYPFTSPNEATPLYRGPLRVQLPAGEFLVEGSVEIAWQPTPQLRYMSSADLPIMLANTLMFERIDAGFYPSDLSAVPAVPSRTVTDDELTMEGHLTQLEVGSGQVFSFVIFQLPNFLNYFGSWVRHDVQPDQARVEMTAAGWRVTIDRRPDIDPTIATLRRVGGYVVTHVGRIEREDGKQFSRQEARDLLDGLYWFCSFVNGSSCGPVGGQNSAGPSGCPLVDVMQAAQNGTRAYPPTGRAYVLTGSLTKGGSVSLQPPHGYETDTNARSLRVAVQRGRSRVPTSPPTAD